MAVNDLNWGTARKALLSAFLPLFQTFAVAGSTTERKRKSKL
jgi:hypothetical protein